MGFVDLAILVPIIIETSLRPPAGRQYRMPISQQPFNRSLPNFQQLLLMSNEGKVENFSSFAYMGNYVNQVHHTINTGESREVKIKIILLDLPLYMLVTCYFVS